MTERTTLFALHARKMNQLTLFGSIHSRGMLDIVQAFADVSWGILARCFHRRQREVPRFHGHERAGDRKQLEI